MPSEPEAAQTFRGPMGSLGLDENQASAAILSQAALGLSFVPRAQFPFAECCFFERFGGRRDVRPYPARRSSGLGWVARASAHRSSSCQISLLREGEHVWSWFQAAETTSQAAVPKEPEAAQNLHVLMGNIGLGEN